MKRLDHHVEPRQMLHVQCSVVQHIALCFHVALKRRRKVSVLGQPSHPLVQQPCLHGSGSPSAGEQILVDAAVIYLTSLFLRDLQKVVQIHNKRTQNPMPELPLF